MTTAKEDGNMIDDLAQFDLTHESAEAAKKKPWQAGHFAKTLFKKQDLRIVLILMENAAKIKEHHADGTLSVQVLTGEIRFTAQGKPYDLKSGGLLTLAASIKHEVEALKDSALLLTISWPSNEQLLAMKHRGYGT